MSKAILNIGMDVVGRPGNSSHEVLTVLRRLTDAKILAHFIGRSNTELTVVITIARPLTPSEAYNVSRVLRQEAIVQYIPDTDQGELYGPNKDAWGAFNPDFFIWPEVEES